MKSMYQDANVFVTASTGIAAVHINGKEDLGLEDVNVVLSAAICKMLRVLLP